MPWKLYLDSRKRVPGARGNSDTDFAIQLPYPITVSGKAYVDCCLLSNTMYTIRTGENDLIYLDELAAQTKRVATLAAGQYSAYQLKDALLAALNTNTILTGQYAVTYLVSANRFQISVANAAATDVFRIWSEAQVKANIPAWFAISNPDLQSANRACGFLSGDYTAGSNVASGTSPDAPDVQPYKQLFIRSSLGGGASESLGCNGETDIIRRILVGNTPMNGAILDVHSTPMDCVHIKGKPELNTLWFQIVDTDGRVVNTHAHPVSFSIIFEDLDE